MPRFDSRMRHICHIKELYKTIGLPPLQPNARWWQKCARFMKKLIVMDVTYAESKDFFRNNSTMRNEMKRHIAGPYSYIVHPFSKMEIILEVAFLVVMMMKMCLLAVHIRKFETYLDTVVDIMWFMIMMSFFLRGYKKTQTKTVYIEPRRIFIHYLLTYFIFDVSIMVCYLIVFQVTEVSVIVTLYTIIFVSYLVRFKSFLLVLEHLLNFMALKKIFFVIYHTFLVTGILHLLTCLVLTNPSMVTMIDAYKSTPMSEINMYDWYVGAFTIVVHHFLGAFFYPTDKKTDDQHPVANFYLFIILLVGRICTLILLAKILEFFGYTNMSSSLYELKMHQLLSYIRFKELTPSLKKKVILHFRSKFDGEYFNERSILGSMSETLRADIFLYGARRLIKGHEALRILPSHVIGPLVAHMDHQIYLTGDVIIDSNSIIEHVYFVASGTLAGYNIAGQEIMHLREGGYFGITSWLVYKRNITVLKWVAIETSEIYAISREALGTFFDAQPDVAKYFTTKMKERVINFDYHLGATAWKKTEKTVLEELKEGVLLMPPRLRLFGFEYS